MSGTERPAGQDAGAEAEAGGERGKAGWRGNGAAPTAAWNEGPCLLPGRREPILTSLSLFPAGFLWEF